ncbi:GNAT family N-acetyltransferase [Gracilibacillus caseinilyticus]|uniref:GNAT family N-acetyltransferase n=1 Tax=Gracilibacillus caseinilyticus TaxID=2932256 RepID=A0ABY4F2W7_9BACI|nr:GNAT family N-acetyltransferase [Gracilibacillus caseinilyticus]UOQ50418.1 GNAT family N-acetyltransferase [Gracilibacillus caseinilyticus]
MIRRATQRDIHYILSKAQDSAVEGALLKGQISQEQAVQMPLAILEQGGHYLVFGNQRNEIAGWILLGENIDFITNQPHVFVYELYVLPNYRNQGIAKQLLQAAFHDSKRHGYQDIRLNVYAGNYAKEIYHKMGFEDFNTVMSRKL